MEQARPPRSIADLRPGDHLCCIYGAPEEHRAVLAPFLRQGLERGEKVLCIGDTATTDAILGYVRDDGPDVDLYLARGQLAVLTDASSGLPEGGLDPRGAIQRLQAETERALAAGYPALRVAREMTWPLRGLPASRPLVEIEAGLNRFLPGSRCLVMCQVDRRQSDPAVLLDALRTHPLAIIGTEIYPNLYYVPASELSSTDPPAAELRHWLRNLDERKRVGEALQSLEATWRALVENAPEKITILDRDGTILFVNRTSPGHDPGQVIGTSVYPHLPPDEQDTVRRMLESVFQRGRTERYETASVDDDGSDVVYSVSVAPIAHGDRVTAALFIGLDIAARRQVEEALRESEGIVRALLEAPTDLVSLTDTNGVILDANEAMAQRFGRRKQELIGTVGWSLVPPDLASSRRAYFDRVIRSREPCRFEDGRRGTWLDNVYYPVLDAHGEVAKVAVIARDITERKQMEQQIQASLREKEVMLGEIHHRVRNNLQVISALLDLQALNTQDAEAREVLRESRARVQSMVLVHEQLYRTPDLARIDFGAYVQTLTSNLLGAYQVIPGHVSLRLDVEDILLEVDQAIPCGFIISELVTNALRHAFPVGRERAGGNEIRVAFRRTGGDECELVVGDNGVGLPADFQFPTRETVGMLLINAYARELKAAVSWERDEGTACRVVFRAPQESASADARPQSDA